MKFRSKNILVTGGSGFIGSNYIYFLINKYKNINIINVDKITYASSNKYDDFFKNCSRYFFEKVDICDEIIIESIFKKYQIDGVINFAAESHVDNSITNPSIFIKTNILGTFNLLNHAYNFWFNKPFDVKNKFKNARFHQISTDEVYGSISTGSFKEDSPLKPNSPYSSSKASSELIVRSFIKTFGLDCVITRCSNNYGPNQNIEKLIPKVIKLLKENKKVPVYGDGSNIRDWIDVRDHIDALDLVYNNSKSGSIYNIGSGVEYTNLEIVRYISKILFATDYIDDKVIFIKDRYGHDYRYSLDCSKINNDLKWKPKNKIYNSLKKYINNYE